jgi:hypothetical protein
MKIENFAYKVPEFNLFEFFDGETKAWGIIEDRFGNLKRDFIVTMNGKIENEILTLEEDFIYSDGEIDKRIWKISKDKNGLYKGIAEDIIGFAKGEESGNAFNWSYKMNIDIGSLTLMVKFDDWMFRTDKDVVINKASISKFGINIANVTIFFKK